MPTTTVGQILINHGLPPELRDYSRVLDNRGIDDLLKKAAAMGPDTYRDVSQHLATLGWQAAQATGANSFGPQHLRIAAVAKKAQHELQNKIREINRDPELGSDEKEQKVVSLLREAGPKLTQDVLQESLAERNPLAMQVLSGARGNPTNLRSLRGADLLYVDHKNRPIPIPILRSYTQGLTPAQYFASTFGARKGVVDTKFCLAGWTLVRLWCGELLPISEIEPGDTVTTFDPRSGLFAPTRVVRKFNNGLQPCFRFYFQHDRGDEYIELVATESHRVLSTVEDENYCQVKRPLREFSSPDVKMAMATIDDDGRPQLGESMWMSHFTPIGTIETWDLQVASRSHLFVLGNGAIVSNSVRNAGFASKQFNQLSHRLVVSAVDDDETDDETPRGLPVETSDPESEGALLATPAGGYPKNTVLTPRILSDLKAKSVTDILIRSPLTSHHPLGGVYARDVGVRQHGRLPAVGENAGIVSAQALSEPLLQMTLGSKHAGGVAAASKLSGFELLNQQVQIPATFKGGAAHAQEDGRVSSIRPAPQGGTYVAIGGKEHYIGRGFKPLVKVGDAVEAGDVLSDGTPNPAELVKHKHLGEGQRQFINNFRRSYVESGAYGHRRNIEAVARGLINHVQLEQEMDSHVPGDIVPYSSIVRTWQPRHDSRTVSLDRAADLYLEKPVLHYSIGTKIKPSVISMLSKYGVKQVVAHRDPPPFRPIMVRAMDNLSHDPDWMTRFLGSNVKKNFLAGVHKAHVSDEAGSSYVPSLARGLNFGKTSPVLSSPLLGPPPTPPKPAASIMAQISELTGVRQKMAAIDSVLQGAKDADEVFYDNDDDDDDDNEGVSYLARHVCLPGYEDELGRDLTMLLGEDEAGKSGAYRLHSAEMGTIYTKPFYKLNPEQYDAMARAYGNKLAEYPIICSDAEQFARFLQSFATTIS